MLVMLGRTKAIYTGGKLFLKVLLALVFRRFMGRHSPTGQNLKDDACRPPGLGWGDLAGVVTGLVLIDSRPRPQDGPAIVVC